MRSLAPLLLLALAACASPTPFVPAEGDGPGWTERRIEPGRWRVRFLGNSATPREAVETALLRRAAETTLAAGADRFRFVSREIERQQVGPSGGTARLQPLFGVGWTSGGRPYGWRSVELRLPPPAFRYEAIGEIVLLDGRRPAGEIESYDARAVLAEIGIPPPR